VVRLVGVELLHVVVTEFLVSSFWNHGD